MKKNIGVIGSQALENFFFTREDQAKQFHVKKVFPGEDGSMKLDKEQFPQAELVLDLKTMIEDKTIDTIIVSEKQLKFAAQVLRAGKAVRVI
jgi:hypothetical protein